MAKRSPQSGDGSSAQLTDDATRNKRSRRPTDLGEEGKDRYFNELYQQPPDFKELANLDPDFAPLQVSFILPSRTAANIEILAALKVASLTLTTLHL